MCNVTPQLGAVLLLLAQPLTGQVATLRARADSLLAEWRQANTFADLQDSLRRTRELGQRERLQVGGLTFFVNPSPLPLAAAAAIAWPQIERFYGPATRAFTQHPFLIQAVDPDTTEPAPPPSQAIRIPWNTDAASLARWLVVLADLSGADPELREWLGGAVVPRFDSGPGHAAVYVQLVTAPSQAVRRCFTGDLAACSDALSLREGGDPVARWYGPEERRALVTTQYADFLSRGARSQAFESCAHESDSACLELLRSLPPGALIRPLDYGARSTLLETAVRLGGSGTFQRLLDTADGPMGRRLAAAARVSEDSLVARWRAAVVAARPTPVPLPPWGPWVALAWVAVFATCGARSSRWRVS